MDRQTKPHSVFCANSSRLAVLCAISLLVPGAHAADPSQEIADLKARLQAQRQQLEEQKRQISAQEAQLREQERLLQDLSTRTRAATGASATGAAAAAAAATGSSAGETLTAPARSEDPTRKEMLAQPKGPEPVTTRFDGIKVHLGGALRTTVNTTTARMQPDATPFFVLPKVNGVSEGTTKIDARLSSLLFAIEGAQIGDFKLGGSIYAYLFNGDLMSGKYGFYPGFAYIDATSDRWRFAAGLQMDVFSPLIPTMVDRMSAFAGSGNPGNSFKPQLRVEHTVPMGQDRWVLQGALADALATNIKPPANVGLAATINENTGLPNAEARIAWIRGRPGDDTSWVPWAQWTLGLSGVTGNFRSFSIDSNFNAVDPYTARINGVALEGAWRISKQLGIQGELYSGRGLGQYLATIFQTTNRTGQVIPSKGGWGEVAWYWTPVLHSHAGYAVDEARESYVAPGGFLRNQTAFLNLFYDPSPKTTLAIEGTWRQTSYRGLGEHSGYSLMLSSELRF